MGLFSYYLGYKRATKKAQAAWDAHDEEAEDLCNNCGYAARQHSDQGDCPTYLKLDALHLVVKLIEN